MASVKIKKEDDVDTDNDFPKNIEVDDLQPLIPKHASRTKYPPGCPVWWDVKKSSSTRLHAKRGVVDSVYIDVDSGSKAYKVSTTSKQNAGGDVVFVWQDQLVYAINCPVMVKGMTENNTATEKEGVIVCHNISKGKIESYSVHFTSDECSVWVELGVNESRVGFRRVEVGGMGGKAASTTNTTSAMKVANGAQSFIAEEATNNNPCSISIIAGEEGAANGHADDPEGNTVSLQNVEQCPNDSQLSSQKKSVPPHEAGAKGNENAQSSHISQRAVNNDQSSKVMGSDKALVNAPPCLREPQISLGKRKQPDASSLSSNSRSDSLVHTEKTPRASEGAATPHPEGEHVVWLLKKTYSALQEVGIPDKENDRVGALTLRVIRWHIFIDVGAQFLLARQFNSEDCRYAEVKDRALAILHGLENKIKCMPDDRFKKENFYTEMETFFSKSINNISQRGRGLINELVCDFSGHTVRKTD